MDADRARAVPAPEMGDDVSVIESMSAVLAATVAVCGTWYELSPRWARWREHRSGHLAGAASPAAQGSVVDTAGVVAPAGAGATR